MIRNFFERYSPVRDAEAGGAAGGADGGTAAAAAAASKPWYDGVDAETVGHWQNKGWKYEDPKILSAELTKSYRSLESKLGAGPDNLLVLPKADAKPEDWAAFHQRLGAPKDAKEYDFSNIKGADGNPMPAPLADALRASAHAQGLSKAAAAAIAADVQKQMDSARSTDATLYAGKLAEEKAALKAQWGTNFDFNHLKAMEGARRVGLNKDNPNDQAAIAALENSVGYAKVMDIFRKIGQSTSEDTFVERGATGSGTPHTRDGAVARKAELEADAGFRDRYLKGGIAEKREMDSLILMIDGAAA